MCYSVLLSNVPINTHSGMPSTYAYAFSGMCGVPTAHMWSMYIIFAVPAHKPDKTLLSSQTSENSVHCAPSYMSLSFSLLGERLKIYEVLR
jgi:hypothetical protein